MSTYMPNSSAPCRKTTQQNSRYGVTCFHAWTPIVEVVAEVAV